MPVPMSMSILRRTTFTALAGALLAGAALPAGVATAAGTAPTRTVLIVSNTPAVTDQPLFLRAVVKTGASGATPTGSITFLTGTTTLAVVPLAAGSAVAKLSRGFAAGRYSFTARYSGDTVYAASTSTAVPVTVAKASTTTQVTIFKVVGPGSYNVAAAVNAVRPGRGTPAGTVRIKLDALPARTVTLDAQGRAHITVSLTTGAHTARAAYAGNVNYLRSAGTASITVP